MRAPIRAGCAAPDPQGARPKTALALDADGGVPG